MISKSLQIRISAFCDNKLVLAVHYRIFWVKILPNRDQTTVRVPIFVCKEFNQVQWHVYVARYFRIVHRN